MSRSRRNRRTPKTGLGVQFHWNAHESNCYLKSATSGASYEVHAEGVLKSTNSWGNCSNGFYYTATYNQEIFLRNWVWEKGKKYTSSEYRKARIAAHRLSGAYTVTGVWSPDSV